MIAGLIARMRSLWRGLRRRSDLEAEMTQEFRLHLELRAADLVRSGLPPAAAARQARLEFGHMESYKREGRESRGLGPFDELRVSWLDVKLGFRMLARYPGLTLVGGLAFAFAICVGAGMFEFLNQLVNPTLPLDKGDRIVALRNWDAAANRVESRALHDFVTWREELESVENAGVYRTRDHNLIIAEAGGRGEPIEVAEMSASGFRLTRVPPLLGRTLLEEDERAGAPPVLVIGFDVWRARFGGDSNVIGQAVRLGRTPHTVVGVMPEGFAFPVAHSFWTPLRLNVTDYERRRGPAIRIFGRLTPGVTLDEAQTELTGLGRRAAADFPETHRHLRPQVLSYPKVGAGPPLLLSSNLLPVMLLFLICANVALLMFARAATRESEMAVRIALGATRGRIISQLFAEALVLGGVAAVVGLVAAEFGLRWVLDVFEAVREDDEWGTPNFGGGRPFWIRSSLSPATVLYAGALTVLGAVMAGVVPALKVTRGVGARLKEATAGGGGLRFGRLWTAVIMTQVAITVAFPAVAFFVGREAAQKRTYDPGFPAQEYLSVRLEMDRDAPAAWSDDTSRAAFLARFRTTSEELERRLEAEPAVAGVTFADRLPRMYHPWHQIDVDEGASAPRDARGHRVSAASIDVDYFHMLGTPILSGRGFDSADLLPGARVVMVNKPFVDQVFGGRNPVGRRVRYLATESSRDSAPGPWYEIVGVARELGMTSGYGRAGIYHPVARGGAYPVHLAVHIRGDPTSFAPRLRAIATATDPTLRLYAMPLDDVDNADLKFIGFWFQLVLLVSSIALLLSLAAIYSAMAFTVARRTREIGIRVALGADPRRVVAAIFRRPLTEVGLGVAVGGVLVAALTFGIHGGALSAGEVGAVVAYAVLMMGVCLLACIVPTRRALRVEPTEALKADG